MRKSLSSPSARCPLFSSYPSASLKSDPLSGGPHSFACFGPSACHAIFPADLPGAHLFLAGPPCACLLSASFSSMLLACLLSVLFSACLPHLLYNSFIYFRNIQISTFSARFFRKNCSCRHFSFRLIFSFPPLPAGQFSPQTGAFLSARPSPARPCFSGRTLPL